ncbi:MAG: ribonuclease P protein component [Actinobacteria bacterium]|nr:ribonuclease P protein component [Actinomycetota bacterium]
MIWRVRDRATFAALARGQRARSGPITVIRTSLPPEVSPEPPRVAYRVGRRVGGAVVRNRVRRRLRVAVGNTADRFRPGWAYLVAVAPEGARAAGADLQAAIEAALERLEAQEQVGK